MDDEKKSERTFTLFGRDLQRIPCFKKTFTVGIYTGFAVGLGSFLFTSRVKRSCDAAVYSFVATTLGYWVYCRYNWTKERSMTDKMNKSLHTVMVGEGATRIPKDF